MSAISPVTTAQSHVAPHVVSQPRLAVESNGPSDTGRAAPNVTQSGRLLNVTV